MNRIRFLLLTLVALLSGQGVMADAYLADFNTKIETSDHAFQVASNWRHIVSTYTSSYTDDEVYVSYSYSSSAGVDGSGALSCSTNQKSNSTYDLLVTPVVKGTVKIAAKGTASYYTPLLEFYKINEDGAGNLTRGDKIAVDVTSLTSNAFTEFTIPVDDAGERIGIRSSYVYLDNFSATEAVIVPESKIKIVSAVPSATNGTIYWEQQANGKVLVKYTVTVENTGDVDLKEGDENFSVSIFNRSTGFVYSTVSVPQALAVGETSDPFEVSAEVDPTIWPNTYTYINMDLKENLFGTVVQRTQSYWIAYEPKFVFRKANTTSTSSIDAAENWGVIKESTTKEYEIANTGTAPLMIKSITLPAGFTSANMPVIPEGGLVIEKGGKQLLSITQEATAFGDLGGNLVIAYLDKDKAEQTYTLPFSANVISSNTWFADFNGEGKSSAVTYPAGVVAEGGINTDYNYSEGKYDIFLKGRTGSSYATENNRFITPKLHAAAGEKLSFSVKGVSGDNYYAKVYISTDRKNWGEPVAYFTAAEKEGAEAIGSSDWVSKSVTFPAEGDYYVAFALYGEFKIDNLVGLTKVDVAHDLYIKSVSWPDASVKSGTALQKPSLDVIPLTDEMASAYTVKYVYGETVLAEATPVALTASATSSKSFSFSWTPVVENTTTYEGTKVVIDFGGGVKFESEPFDLTVTNEPIFHFLNSVPTSKWYEPNDRTQAITFGKTNTADTQNFVIFNWGPAPLTVNSISLPEGFTTTAQFPMTVPAFNGENSGLATASQALDITFSAETAGSYSGDMVITYSGDKTFTLPISGVKLDPTKFYANFGAESNQWPAGSVYQSNVSTTYVATGNYAINSSSSTNNLFITPKLTATAGDKLMFDAKIYSDSWNEGKVVVYAAATRDELVNFDPENDTRTPLFSVSGKDEENPLTTDFQTFEVSFAEAGDYYVAFEISGRSYVDEIYGLKQAAAVAHDLTIVSSNIPAEAMQNITKTATVNVLNLGLADEPAEGYTVTAYVNGVAAGTGTTVTIPATHKLSDAGTALSVGFMTSKVGTFPVYVEVKAGDYKVATAPVDVTFVAEEAKAEATAETGGFSTSVPLNLSYYNSESVSLFTSAVLSGSYGLSDGAKIKSITIKGYKTTDETKSTFNVWYEWTDDAAQEKPADGLYNTESLTQIVADKEMTWPKLGSSSEPVDFITLNFAEPLVYHTGKSLRLLMRSNSDQWKSASFEAGTSATNNLAYYHQNDTRTTFETNSWSSSALPVLHIALEVAPTTYSGTVKNGKGEALAGATVTLTSNDGAGVQYTGTADAEGAYSINVIQNGRTYDVEAEYDIYEKETVADVSFEEGSLTKDFVLKFDPSKQLVNGDFEGEYSVYATPKNDRAIYQPAGWNVAYENGESNDMTALNANCQAWNNFQNRPQPENGGANTYWTRFRWGNSENLTLSQTVKLLPGDYRLMADAFFNGAGGASATISAAGVSKNVAGNSTWSNYAVDFTLTEKSDVTISLNIKQTAANENVVGFDNVKLLFLLEASKEVLTNEIAKAEALKTATRTEGLTAFDGAIDAAKQLLTSDDAAAVDAAVEALKTAEQTFLVANLPLQEGTYYVYNPFSEKFLSRGSSHGTRAVADDYGVAVNVTVDMTNETYKLQSFDNGLYYGDDYWMYADCSGDRVRAYKLERTQNGFYLHNSSRDVADNRLYVYTKDDADKWAVAGNAIMGENISDEAQAEWQFLTKDEYNTLIAGREAAAIAAAKTAAGIANDAELVEGEANELTFAAGHGWTQTVVRPQDNQPATNDNGTEMWQATGSYTQTVEGLEKGLYKVTMQAFYRNGGAEECVARYESGYNTVQAYLDANGNKVQVKSWAADKGEGNDPNSMQQAKAKFDEGKYLVETFAYVGEDGVLNLTVNNPSFVGNGWFIINNVKYVKVIDKATADLNAAKDSLLTAINAAKALNADDYTEASANALSDGITAAETALNAAEATVASLTTAKTDLEAVVAALVTKAAAELAAAKQALSDEIAAAKALNADDYVEASAKALADGITAAETALNADDATVESLTTAKAALKAVVDALVTKAAAELAAAKQALAEEIAAAEELAKTDMGTEANQALATAITTAKAALDATDATVESLTAAKQALISAEDSFRTLITGIANIKAAVEAGKVYDLRGRKVTGALKKGAVYVINGKKVVLK
ncbi:choice-of-anchor J domain-containing protein [Prevotella sp. E13-17]|uniref:choice-of-anchor J domain-containing protein n=1 Tax=Prevotella sp. E13-17 TaxID=2913616 RepID=UPI001EDACE77|nr:choice-of-anchor J domain-containing protein [Prevotella sp. E13-17]UKK50634.1 choice-of-anchor J domain-containing protein [Prevotella sp. E13-17]